MSDDASKQRKKKRNVPTKLKQLAEKRARILGRLLPIGEMETELSGRVAQLTLELQLAARNLESYREQKQSLTVELQHCDEELVSLSPNIDPSKIEPIKGSKGRYGEHGSLRNAILNVLKTAYPQYLTTTQVTDAASLNLNLVFESEDSKYQWQRRSIKSALSKIVDDGKGERGPLVHGARGALNTNWRLKIEEPMRLSDL